MGRIIRLSRRFLSIIFLISSASIAEINDVFLSFQGYTGIINTPNAGILPDGRLIFLFNNQTSPNLEKSYPNSFFNNFIITVGAFPCLEITGRFMNASPYGPRDLSADIKCGYDFGKFNPWLPSLAGGIQDISGGAVYLSTKYLVLSEDIRNLRLSIGYGTGPNRMKGVFYGLEYFISKYLQILLDDDGEQKSGAIRLTTSNDAPFRSAFVLKSIYREKNPVFTISTSLSYDLKKRDNPKTQITLKNPAICAIDTFGKADSSSMLAKMENRLLSCGFENISVFIQSSKLFIRYENNRFNHDEMDALGIVLGAASQISDSTIDKIHVTILKSQVAIASIEVNKKDYCRFLATDNADMAQLKINRYFDAGAKELHNSKANKTIGKIRCEFSPRLRYFLGTEVAPLDYQVSLNFDSFIDLWPGAKCGARTVLPIWNTVNFDNANGFSSYREKLHLNSAMLFQFLNFGHGITSLFSTGLLSEKYFSITNDLRFTDKSGCFKVGISGGYHTRDGFYRTTFLPYIGLKAPLGISLIVTGGTFWEQDEGIDISIIRSINTVDLELFLKRTKNLYNHFDTFIGSQINVPLCFKKGMKSRFVTIDGKRDWHTSLSTRVAEKGSLNYISTSCGVIPELLLSQDSDFFNRNRLDNRYINDNKNRLRNAWLENR